MVSYTSASLSIRIPWSDGRVGAGRLIFCGHVANRVRPKPMNRATCCGQRLAAAQRRTAIATDKMVEAARVLRWKQAEAQHTGRCIYALAAACRPIDSRRGWANTLDTRSCFMGVRCVSMDGLDRSCHQAWWRAPQKSGAGRVGMVGKPADLLGRKQITSSARLPGATPVSIGHRTTNRQHSFEPLYDLDRLAVWLYQSNPCRRRAHQRSRCPTRRAASIS